MSPTTGFFEFFKPSGGKFPSYQGACALAILMLVALWAGCARPTENPLPKNRLKIGTVHRVKSRNILFDKALGVFINLSHPHLFALDPDGEIRGLLSDDYRVSEDFTRWTFRVRDHYFWSDGLPVTASDVTFSVKYVGRHVPSRRWMERSLVRTEVLDPKTAVLVFDQPRTNMDIEFTSFPIIPRHVWENIPRPRFYSENRQFIGCGPFIIAGMDLNAGVIRLRKNSYWKGPRPALEEVEIHMYHNLDVLSLALERGDIDTCYKYADTYPYTSAQRLAETGRFTIKKTRTTGLTFIGFNLKRAPGNQLGFRRAVARALDYREIQKLITSGYGDPPGAGFVPRGMPYFLELEKPTRDPGEAERLLEACGYRDSDGDGIRENADGKPLKLVLLSTPRHHRMSELVAEYLGGVGVEVELRIVESATWVAMKDEYDYHLTITRTTPWGMRMHAGYGTGYFDARRTGEGVLHTVSDPAFLGICDSLLAVRDPKKKKSLARALQQYYARNLPAVALVQRVIVTPTNVRFTGWYHDPLFGIFNLQNFLTVRPAHGIQ